MSSLTKLTLNDTLNSSEIETKKKFEKLSLIEEIIKFNIDKQNSDKITQNDIRNFTFFVTNSKDLLVKMNRMVQSKKKLIIEKTSHENVLKFFLLTLTIISDNSKNINLIFSYIRKLYEEKIITTSDIVLVIKYGITLSTIDINTKDLSKKDQPIINFHFFKRSFEFFIQLRKTLDSNINNEILNFIVEKISNPKNTDKLRKNEVSLKFIDFVNIQKNIFDFLSHTFLFNYSKVFLDFILARIKNGFINLSQKSKEKKRRLISQDINAMKNFFNFLSHLEEEERKIRNKDSFFTENVFVFNDSPNNGMHYQINYELLKQDFCIVFSFQLQEQKSDLEYPVLQIVNQEKKIEYLKIFVLNNRLNLKFGKVQNEINIVEIQPNVTYLVTVEFEKNNIHKDILTLTINNLKPKTFERNLEKIKSTRDLYLQIGFDNDNENEKYKKNFIGYIGPILFFKKIFEGDINHIFNLLGDYSLIPFLAKNYIIDYEKHINYNLLKKKKYQEAINFFVTNDIQSTLSFVISPLTVLQKEKIKEKKREADSNQYSYRELISCLLRGKNNSDYFEILSNPEEKLGTYAGCYTNTSKKFIQYDGIGLLTLNMEYYYTVVMDAIENKELDENLMKSVSEGLCSLIKLTGKIIKDLNYDAFNFEGFSFSFGKVLYLLSSDNQTLNDSLVEEIINFLNTCVKIDGSEKIDILIFKLFFFLIEPSNLDLRNFSSSSDLFKTFSLFFEKFGNLVTKKVSENLLKFRFILDLNEFESHYSLQKGALGTEIENFKKMRKEYKKALSTFIQKIDSCALLTEFFVMIFDRDKSSTSTKYKLLKIFYLKTESKVQLEKLSFSGDLNPSNHKSSGTGSDSGNQKELNLSFTQELKAMYKEVLSESKKKDQIIIVNDNDKVLLDYIRAILILLILEDISKNVKLLIGTEGFSNNSEYKGLSNEALAGKFSTKHKTNLGFFKFPFTKRSKSYSDSSEYTNITTLENDQKEKSVNFFDLSLELPLSFCQIKAIYCCINGKWKREKKISFIKQKDDSGYDLTFREIGRFRKEMLIQYLMLFKTLEGTTLERAIILFLNICDAVIKDYNENIDESSAKCQFIHLFESRNIMITFFMLIFQNKPSFSEETLEIIKKKISSLISNIIVLHPNPFIFSLIKKCTIEGVKEINYIVSEIMVHLSNENTKKMVFEVEEEDSQYDSDNHTFINEYRFILLLRKLLVKIPSKFHAIFCHKQFLKSILDLSNTLLKSNYIFDSYVYYNKHSLDKKRYVNLVPIFESFFDFIFCLEPIYREEKIEENKEQKTDEKSKNKKESTSKEKPEEEDKPKIDKEKNDEFSEFICNLMPKIILQNYNHSICFYIDLMNRNFSIRDKSKYIEEMKEISIQYLRKVSCANEKRMKNDKKTKKKKKSNMPYNQPFLKSYKYTKLQTLKAYILSYKYLKSLYEDNNSFSDPRIERLGFPAKTFQNDISQLVSIIKDFPKPPKEDNSFFVNGKANIENILYDKIKDYLFKNKKSFSFENTVEFMKELYKVKQYPIEKEETLEQIEKERKDSFSCCENNCRDFPMSNVETEKIKKKSSQIQASPSSTLSIDYSLLDFNFPEAIICTRRDILLKNFGFYFAKPIFKNEKFEVLKKQFLYFFPPSLERNSYCKQEEQQTSLKFPSKIKNYNFFESFYPKIFLRPDFEFFKRSSLSTSHNYLVNIDEEKHPDMKLKTYHSFIRPEGEGALTFSSFLISSPFNSICELINSKGVYIGKLLLSKNYILFQTDLNFDEKINYKKKEYVFSSLEYDIEDVEKQLIIKQCDINVVMTRRFLYRNQAIEIFLYNGKSYFFNFYEEEKKNTFLIDLKERNDKIIIIDNYTEYFHKEKDYINRWKKGTLSNFDYLLQINKYSGRSYNELNQYPIFPWVLMDYSGKKNEADSCRKFEYPISVQNRERRNTVIEKYDLSEEKIKVHLRIHYSNSSYVYSYLVRAAPFTYNQIKFQNGNFDNPNRQLYSFEEYYNLLQELTDNRELIPEIFTMPEILYNLNCTFFGRRAKNSVLINNVVGCGMGETEPSFILAHRKILECNYVREEIHKWINNIFGAYQICTKAKKVNSFPPETYEQYMLPKFEKYLKKYSDPEKEETLINKIKNKACSIITLGQAPKQLFTSPHPKFRSFNINEEDDDFESVRLNIHYKKTKILQQKKTILFISMTSNEDKIYCLTENSILVYSVLLDQSSANEINIESIEPLMVYEVNEKKIGQMVIYKHCIFDENNGEIFFTCSHFGSVIKVYSSKQTSTIVTEDYVSCIKKEPKKEVFYSGDSNGKITKWKYTKKNKFISDVKSTKTIIGHNSIVLFIETNEKHNLIISYGVDGALIIRKKYDFEVINIIYAKEHHIFINIGISDYDLIYIQAYNKKTRKFIFHGYTMNGIHFNNTDEDYFLINFFHPVTNELIACNGEIFLFLTKNLVRRKKIKNVIKEITTLFQSNYSNDSPNDCRFVSFAFDSKLNNIYVVLKNNDIIRVCLDKE